MEKRKLTKEEVNLSRKAIKRLEEEREYQQYLADHSSLMLTKGLWQNYLFQRREYELKLKEANREIHNIDLKIIELKRQIKEGVEMKEVNKNRGNNHLSTSNRE